MEVVSSILNIISLLWEGAAGCTNYSYNLEENLNSLRIALGELKDLRDDVLRRVESDEARRMARTNQVRGWLERVEATETEVDEILNEGTILIQRRCLSGCCPKNCLATHKLGKRVVKKLPIVEGLKGKGNFSIVAESLLPASVEALPHNATTGLDLIFEKTWKLLEEDQVGIIGLFGMGGVGKTSLMKKINNEFLRGTHAFDVVIWVVVSKPLNVPRVQKAIMDRLRLPWVDTRTQEEQAKYIFEALVRKIYVFLLDDIWERVDLEIVGIPIPNTQNKSKVVFTTRSKAVCGYMEAQKKIKVECLNWDEAWSLFQNKVGEEALNSHPEIPRLAQDVAKECGGLPLALVTIGRAMASKTTPHEWSHAITVLKKSTSEFSGMGDEVFPILKFSYDSLPNDTIRSCFLYCSLYPEDSSINKQELINQWIGEGFIDGFNDIDEAINRGHDIIGSLKVSCLLESCDDHEEYLVKMHDVIRDLAIWIASEYGKEKEKHVVRAGLGLRGVPEVENWSNTERLSLIRNEFNELTGAPSCPKLLTLLLHQNHQLEKVSDGFFQFIPALKVLDLSNTKIRELPTEITTLVELRFLDLSFTKIEQLPFGLKNWRKLKCLYLRFTDSLRTIPHGEISMLSSLQVFDLFYSNFADWELEHSDVDRSTPSLGELESLKQLKSLGITIKTIPVLQRLLSQNKLRTCTRSLNIRECQGLTSIKLSSSSTPTSILSSMETETTGLGNMTNLRHLRCSGCVQLEELTISWAAGEEQSCSLSHLRSFSLENLPKLKITWERSQTLLCFENLSNIYISNCDALKDLTWLLHVQSLKLLLLQNCKGIEEVIHGEVTTVKEELNAFSRLEIINFRGLPNLKSLCRHALPFPSLNEIFVNDCPKLNKLPLYSNSAQNTLLRIIGEQQWWDRLEWEDETIESIFQHKFQAYGERPES